MKIPREELISILFQFNPWWREAKIADLPGWKRGAFQELVQWIENPPAHRAVLLSGPRQVGKTTLLLQVIQQLLQNGVPAGNILYATFDHPICKLAGLDAVLEAWREMEPKSDGPEYLFLDEAQFIKDIGTWVKHQVDFFKTRRIVFTGSATPLIHVGQESGVGRWHTLRLTTLSFYEYLQIKKIKVPDVPAISSLHNLFRMGENELLKMTESARSLVGHFHEYLVRGGFPQTVLIESITQSQKLLREDIIDKILKRDMTALFGVRRILELEQLFIYLCMHDGGMQDTTTISKELGIAKPTVQNFIDLFESTYLIYRLPPFGYGKEVLRGKNKLYLGDPAIAPAVLMKSKTILEDSGALGKCVETATMCHLWSHCISRNARFSYWKNPKEKEVDLILEIAGTLIPLEVKYQSQPVQPGNLIGLIDFCKERPSTRHGYVITKNSQDLGRLEEKFMRIPAPLFCYWLGANEFSRTRDALLQSE
ncbi:MAG: ATP-binding protein [Verrucomicrobiota bacterium]|nr:ATP-binding protein [Verrucomicrobiota bacterium]